MEYKILTSGRLGEDFAEYTQGIEGVSCTYIEGQEEVKQRIKEFNALAGLNFYNHADISHVRWIHSFGAGVDAILTHPGLPEDLILTRTVGNMGKKMGEYCLAYVLYILKEVDKVRENQKNKSWERYSLGKLFDQKVLIFGTGGIGSGIAEAMGGKVREIIGVNNSGGNKPNFEKIVKLSDLDRFDLSNFNIIINALPLTEKTTGLFDHNLFKRFDSTIFINVGRGASVVESDLIDALNNNRINEAILDVFEEEPLHPSSELWDHEKVIITPHHSALTDIEDVKLSFEKVLHAIKKGETNDHFVDLSRDY